MKLFLGVALVAAPFFIMDAPKTDVSFSQNVLLQLLSLIGVVLYGINTKNPRIRLLSVLAAFSVFMSQDPFGPYHLYQMTMVLAGIMFLATLTSNLTKRDLSHISKLLALTCIVSSIWVYLECFGIRPYRLILGGDYLTHFSSGGKWVLGSSVNVGGSLGNPNHSGAAIAALIPFLPFYLWPLPIVAIILTKSTMAMIALLASVGSFLYYKYKNPIPLALIGMAIFAGAASLLIGIIPAYSFLGDTGRMMAWKEAVSKIGFTIFGNGLGFVPSSLKITFSSGEIFYQLHNEWLETYAISGIVGVLFMAWFIFPVIKDNRMPAINACLIALLVNSLGNFTFHIAPLFIIFSVCFAIQLKETGKWHNQ